MTCRAEVTEDFNFGYAQTMVERRTAKNPEREDYLRVQRAAEGTCKQGESPQRSLGLLGHFFRIGPCEISI